ncbi:pantoate--beta-alanine ligase [Nocardioides sp. GY 10127]|uniref:pantoate--beta-alanine ligase n=1 Tax=Nocardioides sp. GY 10127 TaxID=2569762 RepID=UPI0010A762E1|nr:pantoate--beta-alanine ligase [Nocardioides sp. GY 10127]TIC79399.1 pantoate--beta-alanine ligase [Nocardioides sp. GY 10127]
MSARQAPRPVLVRTRAELAEAIAQAGPGRVGFVPTMGALHDGHASLMAVARERVGTGPVVVSIFVNPLQFGAGEDLDRYPRTLESDLEVCAGAGVDVVFAPTVAEMYPTWPAQPQVTVEAGPLGEVLEGATRPGHYRGVLTVVAKLFGLVRPDVAVFGEKDYQQLVLIRQMVADLCLPVDVVGGPTRREGDGLALSSRNRYLDADQRRVSLALSRALRAGQAAAPDGPAVVLAAARAVLAAEPGVELDYLVLTDPALGDLPAGPGDQEPTEARLLVAARVGSTRLIDNVAVALGAHTAVRLPSLADA